MGRRKSLRTLQRLAEYAADAASREVSQRLRALREEEQRLGQLNGYVADYERLATRGAADLTIGALRGRRGFVERLGEAIGRQQLVVRRHEEQYWRQIDRWRELHARARGLQRFNERVRHAALDRQERREQAALDEITLNQRRR